ncbi:GtrA family protein [Kordia jejudonensis]|uniref:GtrA family protein n=1 Tax=Kordia jejudonensis TaxID=1348245 RepID=UPI0012DFFAF0|nr:GtrA family protein [Kordia jejudonensis]
MNFDFYKQPETVRVLLIAAVGMILGLLTYEIMYYLNPFSPRATISWTITFLIGIVRQHALHRYFTFQHKASYVKSLSRASFVDVSALFFSTGFNWFLSEVLMIHHRIVWVCCLLSTGLISLLFLKKYIFRTAVDTP